MSQATVQSSAIFKQGTGAKGPWTLYKVMTTDGQEPTGFDFVQPGEIIELTQTQNGQYTNLNYKKSTMAAAPAQVAPNPAYAQPAPVGAGTPTPTPAGNDPRVLKLMVTMAEQVGVPAETIKGILEGSL